MFYNEYSDEMIMKIIAKYCTVSCETNLHISSIPLPKSMFCGTFERKAFPKRSELRQTKGTTSNRLLKNVYRYICSRISAKK